MKYKLKLDQFDSHRIVIYLVNDSGKELVWIYLEKHKGMFRGPDGFWLDEDYTENSVWEEYHLHRDEYVAEAKKLLVKHYL